MHRPAGPVFTTLTAISLLVSVLIACVLVFQVETMVGPLFVRTDMTTIRIQDSRGLDTRLPGHILGLLFLVAPIMWAQHVRGRDDDAVRSYEETSRLRRRAAVRWFVLCGLLMLQFVFLGFGSAIICLSVPVIVLGLVRLQPARTSVEARRHASGLCPTCGYDLRATPERCPECGAASVL